MAIQLKPEDLPLTMRCIRGDEWPFVSFTITPDLEADEVSEDSITINCPAGHSYTLRQALQKKLHSRKIADKLLEMMREIFPKLKAEHNERYFEDGRVRWKSEDFPSNPEVVALGLRCARCENPATQASLETPGRERPLCSQCSADSHNENRGDTYMSLTSRAHGRPGNWFRDVVFYRFALRLPPFSDEELRTILARCRAEAKKQKTLSVLDVVFIKSLAQNPSTE